MLMFCYFFYEKVETPREEDTKRNLREHIKEKSIDNIVNPQLILFTKTYVAGSFFLVQIDFFRNFMNLRMGHIDNNCFVESENSAMSRDPNGPKSNHRFYESCDAIVGHIKKR